MNFLAAQKPSSQTSTCLSSAMPGEGAAAQPQQQQVINYRDFSQIEKSQLPDWCVGQPHSGSAFPIRLHYVLSTLEKDEAEILSFQPHGRSFMVRNPDLLLKEILPKWFRQTKLKSFQRQLCLYGFRRISRGPDHGAYYHECFLKGKPFLTHFIKRQSVNGRKTRTAAAPGCEPDFYRMQTCGVSNPSSTSNILTESRQYSAVLGMPSLPIESLQQALQNQQACSTSTPQPQAEERAPLQQTAKSMSLPVAVRPNLSILEQVVLPGRPVGTGPEEGASSSLDQGLLPGGSSATGTHEATGDRSLAEAIVRQRLRVSEIVAMLEEAHRRQVLDFCLARNCSRRTDQHFGAQLPDSQLRQLRSGSPLVAENVDSQRLP